MEIRIVSGQRRGLLILDVERRIYVAALREPTETHELGTAVEAADWLAEHGFTYESHPYPPPREVRDIHQQAAVGAASLGRLA